MRHKRLKLSAMLLLGLGLTGLQAQECTNTTGGDASGSGGSMSYSVGQIVYTAHIGTNGSVSQGVQQPYEISIVTSIEEAKDIVLTAKAYPNPTTDYLTLELNNSDLSELKYELYDINGKVNKTSKIQSQQTQIPVNNLESGLYFIKLIDLKNQEVKIFKITKN